MCDYSVVAFSYNTLPLDSLKILRKMYYSIFFEVRGPIVCKHNSKMRSWAYRVRYMNAIFVLYHPFPALVNIKITLSLNLHQVMLSYSLKLTNNPILLSSTWLWTSPQTAFVKSIAKHWMDSISILFTN